jgi:hypothetical protein
MYHIMWKFFKFYGILFWIVLGFNATCYAEDLIHLSSADAMKVAIKIWFNESGGSVLGLTSWNAGEDFASVGIGHFIWYPERSKYARTGSFLQLIKYMETQRIEVPSWLEGNVPSCPWHDRGQFTQDLYSPTMSELRQFLVDTIPIQAQFMVYRMNKAFNHILASVPVDERVYLRKQFKQMTASSQGIYALVDYVNFKGDGIGYVDRRGHGWGLLQVLEKMKAAPHSMPPLEAFAWSADKVLTQRVEDSKPYKDEAHWLAGWRKRVWSYAYLSVNPSPARAEGSTRF